MDTLGPTKTHGGVESELGAFELRFEPCAALVSVVRRFVSDFYRQTLRDPETISALALATHELLENTVKYSANGRGRLSIAVSRGRGQLEVRVRTRNAATTAHVAALRESFRRMDRATDPDAHYRALILESVTQSSGSGLGLARINAEAGMEMSLCVRGSDVEIVAKRSLPLRSQNEEIACNP